jgi:ubiquinone/menaquinone biosynthesis C-methylase UbiE
MAVAATNPVVETYSRLAQEYDGDMNIHSCWGKAADKAMSLITIKDQYRSILDVGCGTGRAIAQLAAKGKPGVQWMGIDPAENMAKITAQRAQGIPALQAKVGSFESIPMDSASVDYIFSILAFHWVTNLDASVKELKRVIKPNGDMDLFFIGRNNGREFIQATTPIFLKHMGPALLLESAKMRKQLTRDAAFKLFSQVFDPAKLSVEESFLTFHDTLEGHWAWWVRIEGHFMQIAPEKKKACDDEVKTAIAKLGSGNQIPYTIHLLHVKLRQS